jgi:putative membrane protein
VRHSSSTVSRQLIQWSVSFVASVAILVVAGSTSASAQQARIFGPGTWDGGWWMLLGPLVMVVILGGAIALAVALVTAVMRWLGSNNNQVQTPLDILKERYARGEIDKDEYEERKRVLGS